MATRGLQDILQSLSKATRWSKRQSMLKISKEEKKKHTAISKHGKHLNMEQSAKTGQNKSQDNLCRLLIEQTGR